jgi:hypothetical protein
MGDNFHSRAIAANGSWAPLEWVVIVLTTNGYWQFRMNVVTSQVLSFKPKKPKDQKRRDIEYIDIAGANYKNKK